MELAIVSDQPERLNREPEALCPGIANETYT